MAARLTKSQKRILTEIAAELSKGSPYRTFYGAGRSLRSFTRLQNLGLVSFSHYPLCSKCGERAGTLACRCETPGSETTTVTASLTREGREVTGV
jgi:hypothetical protein